MNKTKKLTLTALMGALVFVATMFVHLPVPLSSGYVHIGDAFIYLAACILPTPYAVLSAVIGAGLADAIGYPVYIIPTIIIKALIALTFSSNGSKIVSARNIASVIVASVMGLAGYFFADWILLGSGYTALLNAFLGAFQPVASAVVYVALGFALDRVNFKNRFWL